MLFDVHPWALRNRTFEGQLPAGPWALRDIKHTTPRNDDGSTRGMRRLMGLWSRRSPPIGCGSATEGTRVLGIARACGASHHGKRDTKYPSTNSATDGDCNGSSSGSGAGTGCPAANGGGASVAQVTPRAVTRGRPGKDAPSATDLAAMLCASEASMPVRYEPLSEAQVAAARQVAQLYVMGRDGCAISVDEPTVLNDSRLDKKLKPS